MSFCVLFLALQSYAASAQSWPIPYEATADTLPIVEVHLNPPAHALPQVASKIQGLDVTRARREEDRMSQLQAAYSSALAAARQEISDVVGKALDPMGQKLLKKSLTHTISASFRKGAPLSFLRQRAAAEEFSVRLKVLAAAPSKAGMETINGFERERNARESAIVDTAINEMSELTKIVVAELSFQLHRQMSSRGSSGSFLSVEGQQHHSKSEGLPQEVNVRVGASTVPYPSTASLVKDMESRRDVSENALRQRVLELELRLLKATSDIVKETLDVAVSKVL